MYLVLSYDIPCNSRRAKLHRELKTYLQPVQKSVFEGRIADHRFGELVQMVETLMDHEEDDVRIYHICGHCRVLRTLLGVTRPVRDPRDDTVVG